MTTCRSGGLGAGEAAGAGPPGCGGRGVRVPLLFFFGTHRTRVCLSSGLSSHASRLPGFSPRWCGDVGQLPSVAPQMSSWRAELVLTPWPPCRAPGWHLEPLNCREESAAFTFQRRAMVGQLLCSGCFERLLTCLLCFISCV